MKLNWPDFESKGRALGGKTAREALEEVLKRKHNLTAKRSPLENLSDEDLTIAFSARVIREMHRLGVRRARGGEEDRECDP